MTKVNQSGLEDFRRGVLEPLQLSPHLFREHEELIEQGLSSLLYGDTIGHYLIQGFEDLSIQDPNAHFLRLRPRIIVESMRFLCRAALRAEQAYKENHPEVVKNPNFHKALQRLQRDVAEGVIRLLPKKYAMTAQEGQQQVEFADISLDALGYGPQKWLAGVNYGTFTSKTMKTGLEFLEGEGQEGLTSWTEQGLQEAMPHLTLSNMAMGALVKAILLNKKETSRHGFTTYDNPVDIIDLGSGTGATLAAALLGICEARQEGPLFSRDYGISLVGTELTQKGTKALAEFAEKACEVAHENEVYFRLNTYEEPRFLNGDLKIIEGDMASTLRIMYKRYGIAVVTANYSWHRIPRGEKIKMVKAVQEKYPHGIFLIADLERNASEVNRRYFNFRDNGLLNTGNIGLRTLLEASGCKVRELNPQTAPKSMNPELAKRIGDGTTSDAIFYIAAFGREGERIIDQW